MDSDSGHYLTSTGSDMVVSGPSASLDMKS